ncbi:unnamed protein product, partial [Rotaria magnacalcarata]
CFAGVLTLLPFDKSSTSLDTVSNVFIGLVMVTLDLHVDGPRFGL